MKHGFTLIEELAALTLGSLFMVATIMVLAGIARDRKAGLAAPPTAVADGVVELIRSDLMDAQRMRIGNDGITLSGFNSLNSATLAPDHRPVRVTYYVEHDGDWTHLIRRQEALDVLSNHNTWSELVCDDVAALQFIRLTEPARTTTQPASDVFGSAAGREMPATLRVVMTWNKPGVAPLDRVICLR